MMKYAVDIVMCIDGTGSMSYLIEQVKSSALIFHERLEAKMIEKNKKIDQLRAKTVLFRDYWADSAEDAMQVSRFFNLKTESRAFADSISTVTADGGGDEPENGMEALAIAIQSEWEKSREFSRYRYIIVVWTDASAHPLEKAIKPSYYPARMPKNIDELTDKWLQLPDYKRLLLFANDAYPWSTISDEWELTIHFPSKAGDGLKEYEMEAILDNIANSI